MNLPLAIAVTCMLQKLIIQMHLIKGWSPVLSG